MHRKSTLGSYIRMATHQIILLVRITSYPSNFRSFSPIIHASAADPSPFVQRVHSGIEQILVENGRDLEESGSNSTGATYKQQWLCDC